MNRGYFVSVEGLDGAGKSTFVPLIKDLLTETSRQVVVTREPGGTAVGENLRQMLLHDKMHMETEVLLMFASRCENISQVIQPALSRGDHVICDRFTDSSFAFQGGGRGVDLKKLEMLEELVHGDLQPDLTFLFDLPIHVAQSRISTTRELDKFEQEKADFHARVREEYLRRASESPARFRIIDSSKTIPEITNQIREMFFDFLADKNKIKTPSPHRC